MDIYKTSKIAGAKNGTASTDADRVLQIKLNSDSVLKRGMKRFQRLTLEQVEVSKRALEDARRRKTSTG